MCVKHVIKDVQVTWHINANRRAVIAWPFLHARFPMFESRASCVIEHLGVAHVSTSTRKISCGARQCEQKKNCAACGSLLTKNTTVISRTVQTDFKRVKICVHEDFTHVYRQRFIFTYAPMWVTRGIWYFGNQILISSLFQYKYESELGRAHSRRIVFRSRWDGYNREKGIYDMVWRWKEKSFW